MKLSIFVQCAMLVAGAPKAQSALTPARVEIGRGEAPLTGPWAFQIGDNPRWADPAFDDADWERVDLTPAAGSHDLDVGLTAYVPGWMERGHPGHYGYAWYRMRLQWKALPGQELVLLGPASVDDVYELYWNGRRIGASGDFEGRAPRVYATKPALFRLPAAHAAAGEAVVALRVYMSPAMRRDGDAGGIHIAPILAEAGAGAARHTVQWSQTFWGYVVDVVEPALFALLAAFALFVARLEPSRAFHSCLAAALLLTAVLRINQAIYFWLAIEDLPTFVFIKGVLLEPLGLLAWTWTWNRWGSSAAWIDRTGVALAIASGLSALAGDDFALVRSTTRVAFMILMLAVAVRIARRGKDWMWALLAMVLIGTGQFAEELWALGFSGIWFPFGVGVSRTQYAYAAFVPVLTFLLARRALRTAAQIRSLPQGTHGAAL